MKFRQRMSKEEGRMGTQIVHVSSGVALIGDAFDFSLNVL